MIAEIYNLDGQLFLRQALVEPVTEIDIRNVEPGIYIIKLANDYDVWIKRVIIYWAQSTKGKASTKSQAPNTKQNSNPKR